MSDPSPRAIREASSLQPYDPPYGWGFNPLEELALQANRGNLIALIRHTLETNGFRLLFQPIISLRGDEAENYETFLRLLAKLT